MDQIVELEYWTLIAGGPFSVPAHGWELDSLIYNREILHVDGLFKGAVYRGEPTLLDFQVELGVVNLDDSPYEPDFEVITDLCGLAPAEFIPATIHACMAGLDQIADFIFTHGRPIIMNCLDSQKVGDASGSNFPAICLGPRDDHLRLRVVNEPSDVPRPVYLMMKVV